MKKIMVLAIIAMLVFSSAALLAKGNSKTNQLQSDDNTGKPIITNAKPVSDDSPDKDKDKTLERAYPGYLSDVVTAMTGKDKKGNDMRKNPGKHQIKDMRANDASGFGVFLRLKKGDYKFFKLDAPGSIMAKDILATTPKTSNVYVIVKGTILPDGSIKTSWIREVKNGKDKAKDDRKPEKPEKDKTKGKK